MTAPRTAHPAIYLALIIPFGVLSGYGSVTLGYALGQAGVTAAGVAGLVAVYFLPQTWKFLWAPVADLTLTRKRWYVLAALLLALGFVAMGVIPPRAENLALLSASMLVASTASTFLAMSVESLMAYGTPDAQRGRAGGWFQAGNLGGQGLGGGAGLWLAQHFGEPWLPAAALAVVSLLCCAALALIPEPPPTPRGETLARSVRSVLLDLWSVARSRGGFLALLVCFLPIGTGAAGNLFAAIADDWRASANTVALVTGALGGIASAIGCLIGGYLCDRMDRKTAYWVFGLAQALCAVAMALTPRTEPVYMAFVMLYWVITGFAYAAFSAVVLEAIGHGAAATKYNVFASLSNMPIAYLTIVDGWAYGRWHANGLLAADALSGIVAVAFFAAVSLATRPRVVSPA